jgi:RimJ/RimL family protein N-acetyltransferase
MLIGSKVVLEEVAPKSIEQLRLWRNDPNMRQWFREYKDITPDKQNKWYAERGNNSNPEHVYFQIMARQQCAPTDPASVGDRRLVGCCGLCYVDFRLRKAEFSIFVGPEHKGRGYGKEALKLMCDYGFKEMNLHKIWCEVYEGNQAVGLYRALGFKDEGIARDNWFHNGKYGNSILMSVLESEWI